MYVNRDHLRFDLDMEILCMLPASPVSVPIDGIAHDLGVTPQKVRIRLVDLQQRYRVIRITHSTVTTDHRHSICRRAGAYWNHVYGDQPCPAIASSPTPAL